MNRLHILACLALILLLVPSLSASITISTISPSSWPNNSIATLTITGSNLGGVTWIRLNKCSQHSGGKSVPDFYGSITRQSDTSITATFSLYGKIPGEYDISVGAPIGGGMGDDIGYKYTAFTIYANTGTTPKVTTTAPSGYVTTTETTVPETTATSGQGENSVFFESNPGGAEVWLEGEYIGTTAFTYYTNREGTYNVLVKKIGYEDYDAKVTTLEGKRVHFYALLSPLSGSAPTDGTQTTQATGKPAANVTTTKKSILKIPTPLPPDPTSAEESPVHPVTALLAVFSVLGFFVIRRR